MAYFSFFRLLDLSLTVCVGLAVLKAISILIEYKFALAGIDLSNLPLGVLK